MRLPGSSFIAVFAALLLFFCMLAEAKPARKPSNKPTSKRNNMTMKRLLRPATSFRAAHFTNDKTFSDQKGYLVGSAWLTLRPIVLVYGWKGYFEGYVQNQDLVRRPPGGFGSVREFYISKQRGAFDFKLGRQIVSWGKADKINPTDSFVVRNMRMLTTDDEEQKTGAFGGQIAYNFESSAIRAIWQSEWITPRTLLAPVDPGVRLHHLSPKDKYRQLGLKYDHSSSSADYSLSYFNGFDRTPDANILTAGPNGVDIALVHQNIHVLGADVAFNLGDFGLRGEMAYTLTKDGNGKDPLTKNPFFFAVLGADRSFEGDFYLNLQLLYLHVMNWVDPEALSAQQIDLAKTLQRYANQRLAQQGGTSFRVSKKFFNQQLEMEMSGVYYFGGQDYLLRPKLIYALNDTLKFNVGAEIFGGPHDSFLGQFSKISSVFTELRYTF